MNQPEVARAELPSGVSELRRIVANTPTYVLLQDDPHATKALRTAARALADEARAHDAVRAERLLIELRRVWRELPEARRLEPQAYEQLWERLVTACIEEFYRPANPPR
jgi:hypothetical protein